MAKTKVDTWAQSDDIVVGTAWAQVDEFGRVTFWKAVGERNQYMSRDTLDDMDDFDVPEGRYRQVALVMINEAEALSHPSCGAKVAADLAAAAATRDKWAADLAAAGVAYDALPAWWLAPSHDSPRFGDCYGKYEGLGEWRWYREAEGRTRLLKLGGWARGAAHARRNDYLWRLAGRVSGWEPATGQEREAFNRRRSVWVRNAKTLMEAPWASTEETLAATESMTE